VSNDGWQHEDSTAAWLSGGLGAEFRRGVAIGVSTLTAADAREVEPGPEELAYHVQREQVSLIEARVSLGKASQSVPERVIRLAHRAGYQGCWLGNKPNAIQAERNPFEGDR